jgi:hypothetical protein
MIDDRIEQIRRAHASATPNSTENPAWFHAENEIGFLLAEVDRLRALYFRLSEEISALRLSNQQLRDACAKLRKANS